MRVGESFSCSSRSSPVPECSANTQPSPDDTFTGYSDLSGLRFVRVFHPAGLAGGRVATSPQAATRCKCPPQQRNGHRVLSFFACAARPSVRVPQRLCTASFHTNDRKQKPPAEAEGFSCFCAEGVTYKGTLSRGAINPIPGTLSLCSRTSLVINRSTPKCAAHANWMASAL